MPDSIDDSLDIVGIGVFTGVFVLGVDIGLFTIGVFVLAVGVGTWGIS